MTLSGDSAFDDLSLSSVLEINKKCNAFEAEWQAGRQPRVEDYLDSQVDPECKILLHELLSLDAHYRQRSSASSHVSRVDESRGDQPFVSGYDVLREIGRGGMGVVYEARQHRPNRVVALKMISAGIQIGPRELERFRRESDAVAQLQHANIVQVYEVGEQDGRPYFALEYVAGGSLSQYLAGVPQPSRRAAQIVEQLALAIHHAHNRGIIHRDLKPANILLQVLEGHGSTSNFANDLIPGICPKVTDFGLAKLLGSDAGHPTLSSDVLGTPSYMAPEQLSGGMGSICPATDVYGLGAILYEMLTGRPPFRAETALETVLQVQNADPVSPSRLQPKCPRDLVTICQKCLRKSPNQRYSSALDLAADLRRFIDGQSIHARPIGPLGHILKWMRRQPLVASLAGLLVLAVVAGVCVGSWFWWKAEDGLKKAEVALGKEFQARSEREATLDRHRVALAHREWLANNVGRSEELLNSCTEEQRDSWEWRYLDRLHRSAILTLAGHTNCVQSLAIHPSGRKVASASHDSSIRQWDLDTGRIDKVIGHHQSLALSVAYSPDGRFLASAGSHDSLIKLWDGETGAELQRFRFGGRGEVVIWTVAFDPSSRYLAVGGPRRVKIWDTRERKWIYERLAHQGAISKVAFSSDGRSLATAMTNIRVWDWKSNSNEPLHDWPGHETGTYDMAFSPDGNLLVSGGRDGLIRVHNLPTGKEESKINAHELSVTSVCFSPDGERLASAGQEGDMHIWNLKDARRLFTLHGHSGAIRDLVYTPDGKRLVSAGQDYLIRVWDATETQEARTLPVQIRDEVGVLEYNSDGRLLAWGDIRGRVGVWDMALRKEVFRLDDNQNLPANRVLSLAFSADGRRVACRWRNAPVRLWNIEGGVEIPLMVTRPDNVLGLAFSANGKQLLAATTENETLMINDLYTAQNVLSLPRPGCRIAQVTWSPDAQCFVTLEDRRFARRWAMNGGRLLNEVEYQPSLTCMCLSLDGRFLAVAGIGGGLRIWNLVTNREAMAATGHSSRVYGLTMSPNGERLASSGSDCTAKLWNTRTGQEVLTLRTQLHERSPLAFNPDGTELISVNMNNQLQIWSTKR